MNKELLLKVILVAGILIISKDLDAQIRPMGVDCPVNSISPTVLSVGSGAGQVAPTVTVSTLNNCTTYTISCSYSWISYSRNGLNVTISVQANTGPARTGYVNIGTKTLTVNQACGNLPVAPTKLNVNRNNFCAGAYGTVTISAIGGSGTAMRWFRGSCGGTQIGYTDVGSLEISAPTVTTTYYARWETSCGNSACKSVTVTVKPVPTASAGNDGPKCAGSDLHFTSSGGSTYAWTGPNGFTSSLQNPTITAATTAASGTYFVTVTSSQGCTSQTSTFATVNSLPVATAYSNSPVCNRGTIALSGSGGTNYLWTGPEGFSSNQQNPDILNATSDMAGIYILTVTNANGCSAQASVLVTVYDALTASLSVGTYAVVYNTSPGNLTVTASGGTGTYTYLWYRNGISTGVTSQTYNPGSLTSNSTFYCAVTSGSCGTINTETIEITILDTPETRTINLSLPFGTTNGSLNVDATGAAVYSIPLELLPGVNGLTPDLSVNYSSNGGAGIVGYGWNIGGISTIRRGPQTFFSDGTSRGVELDANDRFYLNGQRLVNTAGSYGDAGAIYQTENDIFTRVIPKNTDSGGPGWFRTETKSGLICEYGNTTDSKQKVGSYPQTFQWYVSKISDLHGNQINFGYTQDHNMVYPDTITYGPNLITFIYKSREDKEAWFIKGAKTEQWLLLDSVVVRYNSNVVKSCKFIYSTQGSSYNTHSVLSEVVEYGTGSERLNSTVFSYQVPENIYFPHTRPTHEHDYIKNSKQFSGDFNGDGKSDLLCLPDTSKGATWTGVKVFFSNGYGTFTSSFSSSIPVELPLLRDLRTIDLNADGIDDLLYERYSEESNYRSYLFYSLCDGNSFSEPTLIESYPYQGYLGIPYNFPNRSPKNRLESDYNGDGVNDIFTYDETGHWKIRSLANSSGELTSSIDSIAWGTLSSLSGTDKIKVGDFNGDGKTDIWHIDTGVKIYTLSGSQLVLLYNSSLFSRTSYYDLGDYNGDGKTDVFIYGDNIIPDWDNWQIQLSTGAGFEQHIVPQKKENLFADETISGDFNGDGATDFIGVTSVDDTLLAPVFYISKNNGTDFYTHNPVNYSSPNDSSSFGDFNGDGRYDYLCTRINASDTVYSIFDQPGKSLVLMEEISNGLGAFTKLSYKKLSQGSAEVYNRGSGAAFPVTEYQGPWSVVSSVESENGKGTMNKQIYHYKGAKIHLQGKGFLGYSATSVRDAVSGMLRETIAGYDLTYYYPKIIKSYSRLTGTTDSIEVVKNTWSHLVLGGAGYPERVFPYIQCLVSTNKLTGGAVTGTFQYDNYGNPTSIVRSYSGGRTETTTNYFDNTIASGKWLLGRPTSTSILYTSAGNPNITRSATRVFKPDNNKIESEKWHSGTSQEIINSFIYNPNGTLKKETVTAGGVARSVSYTYKADSIRIHTATDQLAHTTISNYDAYGRLYTSQDYLGNTMTYLYDSFGRQTSVASSDGSQSTTVYSWEDPASDPLLARYSVTNIANDGSQSKTWYDKLGRVIRSDVKGFDGTMICTSTSYNLKGQVESVSDPYFSTGAPQLNVYSYDSYGRQTALTRPSGRNTAWSYSNNTVTETTAGKSFSRTVASDGNVSSATDPGGTITYSYFADGKVKSIVAPGSITTSMQYDIAGNQTSLTDPSAGTISYTYNGFGELISQVNPGSVTTSISYLADGRIDTKTAHEGVTRYRYNSNKQLANIKSPSNVSRSLGYDSKGRVTAVTDSLPGSNPLVTSITYDSKGRKSTVTHPSAITETYGYNQNGYLSSVSAGGSVRWTTTGINARGQLTTGTYGSNLNTTMGFDTYGFPTSIVTGTVQNYSYNFNPVTGNLAWRQNNKYTGLREDFQYDNSDRLSNVTKSGVTTLTMSYDGNTGGITGKSDAGTFTYDAFEKPYAIKSIDPTTGLSPDSTQTIGYTSFNKVESISENGYEADLIYGSDDQRSRMIVKQNGNTILTRWYPTGSYMKETAGGVTKEYTFIGGDGYTAPVAAITQGGTTTYYNLLRDHLGSITHVVSSSGAVVAEYSYDAWGRMRNPSTWVNYEPGSEPALIIAGRGFTGHEHLPWFNTINMNGRLYDPLTGMFLSPDNSIQSAEDSQNFNRYSYGLNNPLKYSDPSGQLLEPLPNPADAGYPYNPEAAAFLANCYYQFDCSYGGGGGDGTYTYNWYTGNYYNGQGEYVTWDEVYNNYVVPNSYYSGTVLKGFKVGDGIGLVMTDGTTIGIGNNVNVEYFADRTKFSGPVGEPVAEVQTDYEGVKGLTIINYYVDQAYVGQCVIDISYTSPYTKGGNWTQLVTLKSPSTHVFYDDGSRNYNLKTKTFYYTADEMKEHTFGNTVTFHDNPYIGRSFTLNAILSLETPSEGVILSITWGMRYRSGVQNPNTLFPLHVTYHKH